MKNRNILTILLVLTIIFTIMGGSLAYFTWQTSVAEQTAVTFTVEKQFSCSADGGGNITVANLTPTDSCTGDKAIKRTIKSMPQITGTKTIYMDLWLDVNEIGTGLTNSNNFKYALTTSSTSCTTGVVSSGTFKEKTQGSKISLLSSKKYSQTVTDTYYLYIWLDSAETSTDTMNQSFSLSLNGKCTDDTTTSSENIKPATPELDDGMIPVVIDNSGSETTVKTISKNDSNWYNYENKKWANAVMVTSNSRANYKNTSGVSIPEDDILAYYVWIPRYKYAIPDEIYCSKIINPNENDYPRCYNYSYIISDSDKPLLINWWQSFAAENFGSYTMEQATSDVETCMETGKVTIPEVGNISFVSLVTAYNDMNDPDITYTKVSTGFSATNKTPLARGPKEIDIIFEDKNTTKSTGDAINSYLTHPAFTLGDAELNGIWVGKFETSPDPTSNCYKSGGGNIACYSTQSNPRIKPNVLSLRAQARKEQFKTSRKFGESIYGSTSKIDAHMMKNIEWGAVAYLSHSKYGINREIYINNSSDYYTGRSAGSVGSSDTKTSSGGTYTWDGKIITGTVIGDYANDRTLGTNASTTGNITGIYDMSGGAGEYVMAEWISEDKDTSVYEIDLKYYDIYRGTGEYPYYTTCGACYGHALYEVDLGSETGWYDDTLAYPDYSWNCIRRGGHYDSGKKAGIFNSGQTTCTDGLDFSFRSVIAYTG